MEIDTSSFLDEKIRKFSSFQNPNNFDDYYTKVLPQSKNIFF